MDFFVQVSPCMCSDRVGSAVAIFDVFQNAISDVTFPISEMAFLIDVVQEYKIHQVRSLNTLNHSKLANNKFKLLPRSNKNISISRFFFFSPPSSSLFLHLCLHHPSEQKLVRSRNGRWWYNVNVGHTDLSAMLDSWTSLLTHVQK